MIPILGKALVYEGKEKRRRAPIGLGSNAVKILVSDVSLPVLFFVCLSPPSFLSHHNASFCCFSLELAFSGAPLNAADTDVSLVFHIYFMSHTGAIYIQ